MYGWTKRQISNSDPGPRWVFFTEEYRGSLIALECPGRTDWAELETRNAVRVVASNRRHRKFASQLQVGLRRPLGTGSQNGQRPEKSDSDNECNDSAHAI